MKTFYTFFICSLFFVPAAFAEEFSSSNFTVSHPVLFPDGFGSSTSFGLLGVIAQPAVGNSVATNFQAFGGFLYFPYVSTPVLAATPGSSAVSLSWDSASTGLGWSVGSYSVGQSTVSGGPYSFTNVGGVLSYNVTSLTNGTPYYFVVRVLDALGNSIATSTQSTATPVNASVSGGGGGGGGGGGSSSTSGAVHFSGRAYPKRMITFLKDAQVGGTTIADVDARFETTLSNLTPGSYMFSVYSEDASGRRSSLLTFPVNISLGVTTDISGIFIAPTIDIDKSEVKKGDGIAIFGQTTAQSDVTIQVNSDEPFFVKTKADTAGIYLFNFDTAPLEYGDHSTKSKSAVSGEISSYSSAVAFKVGEKNVSAATSKFCLGRGDVNNDCRVNLVDFSIVAYWYKRPLPPAKVDFNGDKKVTLIDFSVLAFYWTG